MTRDSSSRPGDAFYAKGRSGLRYWFGHLERAPSVGTKFREGDTMGMVLNHKIVGGPHVHVGINTEDGVRGRSRAEAQSEGLHARRPAHREAAGSTLEVSVKLVKVKDRVPELIARTKLAD